MEDSRNGSARRAVTSRLAAGRDRASWKSGLVGVVVLGLLALAVHRGLVWQDARQRVADEKDVLAAATSEVEALVGVSGSTSKEDIDTLLDGATADFRKEFEVQADRLRKALTENKVSATGEVVSAGVVKLEDGRATVIVAAVGMVENKQTAKAEPRNYRLRVDLQQAHDRWLVSGLEFVA